MGVLFGFSVGLDCLVAKMGYIDSLVGVMGTQAS
jgi:hypothetical protein